MVGDINSSDAVSTGYPVKLMLLTLMVLMVLLTVAFAYFNSGSYVRDQIRTKDIALIQKFLEAAKTNNGAYPASVNYQAANWQNYLEFYPTAPAPDNGCGKGDYEYTPINDRTSYQLYFCLAHKTSGFKSGINVVSPQ